jgi:hypothetical protein
MRFVNNHERSLKMVAGQDLFAGKALFTMLDPDFSPS